ncbi:MAG: hypothetical protein LUC95_12680 [Lachnospiraceae bacterium]|nr:hypothetical protein [Lachnospiraceae bacterium]
MNDLTGLQEKLDAFDKLLQALMPFVSPPAQRRLEQLRQTLQPFSQLQEMMEMLNVMNAMQNLNSASDEEETNPEDAHET